MNMTQKTHDMFHPGDLQWTKMNNKKSKGGGEGSFIKISWSSELNDPFDIGDLLIKN